MPDRLALIIANSEFDDPKIARLVTPAFCARNRLVLDRFSAQSGSRTVLSVS